MTEDLLERIRRLCERLVEIAPWWSGWWTPVAEGRLAEFEQAHGIELPSGYRRLLAAVGAEPVDDARDEAPVSSALSRSSMPLSAPSIAPSASPTL